MRHVCFMETRYHYQIMARALEFLHENSEERPSLETIAKAQNLSPFHFQRLFSEWVGVSPKTYLEHLQLAQAKPLLRARMGTFQAAESAGLSGTGRLHDLLIKWEAVTPGEFAKGKGEFQYGVSDTPFGPAVLITTSRGLAGLAFVEDESEPALRAVIEDYQSRAWPNAKFTHDQAAIIPYAQRLSSMQGELPVSLIGTAFQHQIWRALLEIPEGRFSTYGDIGDAIGRPRAARAVGRAVGQNPVAWLIPCHRVIRSSGALGGYHWGLPRKEAMIAYESARAEM